MDTKKVVIVIAGVVAAVGQFVSGYYLALIGGVVAALAGLSLKN